MVATNELESTGGIVPMTRPSDIPEKLWKQAEVAFDTMPLIEDGWDRDTLVEIMAHFALRAQAEATEAAAKTAEGDCDWSQFSRASKKNWRGDEANIFAPPADDDGTMPTDVNVFAYRIGIASGRAIAAAIRSLPSAQRKP